MLGADGYISRKQNGTTGYLFKNAHGDVLAAYSSTTSKLADYTYDAWGEAKSETETSSFKNNPLRYCGEYYDYESGMTYLRARYYDSGIRRFITEDPIKDGVNWYAYAGNNPVMFVDPSGLRIILGYDEGHIMEYLRELSDDYLYIDEYGEVQYEEREIRDREVGTLLIRRIIDDDKECKFKFNDMTETRTSYDDLVGASTEGEGSGATIHFYTGDDQGVILMDGSMEEGYHTKKKMELAHELIHVLRAFGGHKKREQKGTGYIYNNGTQYERIEEFETIGINYKDDTGKFVETTTWKTTENRIRVEQRLKWRGKAL